MKIKIILIMLFHCCSALSLDYTFSDEIFVGFGNKSTDLAISTDGTGHLVWTHLSDGYVYYCKKALSGRWEYFNQIPGSDHWGWQFNRSRISAGSNNDLCVVWGDSSNQTVFYSTSNGGDVWSDPVIAYSTDIQPGCSKPVVAVINNDLIHIIFERHISNYMTISHVAIENGVTGNLEDISCYQTNNMDPDITIDADGTIHCAWIATGAGYIKIHYRYRNPEGNWSQEEVLNHPGGSGTPDLSLSSDGIPHLIWTAYMHDDFGWYVDGIWHAAKKDGVWTASGTGEKISSGDHLIEGDGPAIPRAALNRFNDYFAVWPENDIFKGRFLRNGIWSEILTVPVETTAFWPELEGARQSFILCYGTSDNNIYSLDVLPLHNEPIILAAGFMDTDLSSGVEGIIQVMAAVDDPNGLDNIMEVKLLLGDPDNGEILGYLYDDGLHGDFGPDDMIFGGTIPWYFETSGPYLLSIVAIDYSGNESDSWPHLTIHGSKRSPMYWRDSVQNWYSTYMTDTDAPYIKLGGYLYSYLEDSSHPSSLSILVWAVDNNQEPADRVTLFYDGVDTGFELYDDGLHIDGGADDGFFGVFIELPENSLVGTEGEYLFELGAWDASGTHGPLWPYLFVEESKITPAPIQSFTPTCTQSPTSSPTATPRQTSTNTNTPTPTPNYTRVASILDLNCNILMTYFRS